MTLFGIPVTNNYLTLFTSPKSHFFQFVYNYSLNVIQKKLPGLMLLISKEHKYRHIVFHLGIKLNLVKSIASLCIMELIYCTFCLI